MRELPVLSVGALVLLHTPPPEATLTITTLFALQGPVCVIDAGNQFNAYSVARLARRRTVELNRVLGRIQVARGFTCYQVVTLFDQLPNASVPHVVFDLLSTFNDESTSLWESQRLLARVIEHLKRLRQTAPVVVSASPPRQQERSGLMRSLMNLADHVSTWETPLAIKI